MTPALHRAATLAVLLCMAAPAAADTLSIEAVGEAQASDAAARARALDLAFADAVSRALDTLLTADVRRRHQAVLLDQVIRRARLYIGSYKVAEETRRGPLLRVRIAARVDVDGLRERLAALGIGQGRGASASTPAGTSGAAPSSRRAALLLGATVDGERLVTFGDPAGDGGALGRALAHRLREQGLEVVSTAGLRVSAARVPARGLPLNDQAAAFLAQDAGAGVAFVIGAELGQPGRIHGTNLHGAAGRAALRVLDVVGPDAQLVAEAEVSGGGFADTPEDALAAAATSLARQATGAVAGHVAAYWPPSVPAGGALLIEVEGFSGWQNVDALIAHLARTHGIRRVWPRQVGARGVTLAVDTELSRRRVASALRLANLPAARLDLAAAGDGILVTLHEDPAQAKDPAGRETPGAQP